MFTIGICDDFEIYRSQIMKLCEVCFEKNDVSHQYVYFSSGEEIIKYCAKKEHRIDLLFLDVKLPGMSGIEVKDMIAHKNSIWRVVFVSNYGENVWEAFGTKTVGFIEKPPSAEKINKIISKLLKEKENDILIEVKEKTKIQYVRLEDVAYMKAEKNYTRIFFYTENGFAAVLSSKKVGDFESELSSYGVIRVHKSYLVNLKNVLDVKKDIMLRDINEPVPIGRKYKKTVMEQFRQYMMRCILEKNI